MRNRISEIIVLCFVTTSFAPICTYAGLPRSEALVIVDKNDENKKVEYKIEWTKAEKRDGGVAYKCEAKEKHGEKAAIFTFSQNFGLDKKYKFSNVFMIYGQVEEKYKNLGIGPIVRRKCTEMMKEEFKGAGFVSKVASYNYPSLSYNITGVEMKPYGVDCSGEWLFTDGSDSTTEKLKEEVNKLDNIYKKKIDKECVDKIKEKIFEEFNNENSEHSGTFSIFEISYEALKKRTPSVKSPEDYYKLIVDFGKKYGIFLAGTDEN